MFSREGRASNTVYMQHSKQVKEKALKDKT